MPHIASSHSMHEVPSPHASAHTGTTHEHSPGCAMPGRMVDDMQGGCGSCEPAAARRAPAPDEVGCRCASHISDGQRGLPPGDSEGSSLLAPPPAAAESDGRQRVPRRRAPHGSRGFIVRRGPPKKYVVIYRLIAHDVKLPLVFPTFTVRQKPTATHPSSRHAYSNN